MNSNKINGYTLEVASPHKSINSRFITLIDKESRRFHFNMINQDGQWMIRNRATVPAFIVEIEQDIARLL